MQDIGFGDDGYRYQFVLGIVFCPLNIILMLHLKVDFLFKSRVRKGEILLMHGNGYFLATGF